MDGTQGTVQRYTMSRTTLDAQGSRRMDGTSVTPGTVQQYTMSRTTLDAQGSRRMDGTPGTVQ